MGQADLHPTLGSLITSHTILARYLAELRQLSDKMGIVVMVQIREKRFVHAYICTYMYMFFVYVDKYRCMCVHIHAHIHKLCAYIHIQYVYSDTYMYIYVYTCYV